jgi:hypothetical protein
MRTGNLIATAMTVSVLFAGASFGQSYNVPSGVQIVVQSARIADRQSVLEMVAELTAAGFTYIEIHRTFLGRARLVAYSATEVREVILNPTTGEILRDLVRDSFGNLPEQANSHAATASENGNKGGNGKGNNGNAGGGNRN